MGSCIHHEPIELVALLRDAILGAARLGQIHPDAATDAGLNLLSILHFGVISQHLANDPDSDWEHGAYTTLHQRATGLFIDAYPPKKTAPGTPARLAAHEGMRGTHSLGTARTNLRASTNLKMPDCCVLLAAEETHARVASFDDRLADAAANRKLVAVRD